MKLVNKLLLVSAIAASSQAFAMESMSEADMSQTTGQDGVTLSINLVNGVNAQMFLHDTDGLKVGATAGPAGAIVFGDGTTAGNFKISNGIITIDVDADGGTGAAAATAPMLNVKVGLPTLTITTGDISVAKSNGFGTAVTNSKKIFNSTTVTLGAMDVNIQLGAEAQGSMLKITNGSMTGGLTLTNFAVLDNYDVAASQTNVGIGATTIKIKDSGAGANLTLGSIKGDVTAAAGLQFTLASIGDATNGIDVQVTGLKLGDQAGSSVGNLEMRGLNMNGTILGVKGH
ncbi:MAG: hypothetical protein RLY58_264 [Pseudomonadota bacterium]|jgi:hypothetical protein